MSAELAALDVAYTDLVAVIDALGEAESWAPSGCAGWAVRDLVFHLLGDAQRALVALATPAPPSAVPDRDAATYWADSPGKEDPDSRNLRAVRTMASAWRLPFLTGCYAETTTAVRNLAAATLATGAAGDTLVETQGHVLRVADLINTLVVEAAVHHLDLVVALDRPGPGELPLEYVSAALDGLLGHAPPSGIDSARWIRVATGRDQLTELERETLGPDAERLPLLH